MNHPVRYATERLALRGLFGIFVALFVAFVVPLLWDVLSPFIIAVAIAASLQPLIRFFEEKLHMNRSFAVVLWVALFSAVAILVVYWFASFVAGQIASAANNAPTIVNNTIAVLREAADRIIHAAESLSVTVSATLSESLNTAFKWLGEQATNIAGATLNLMVGFASSLPYALIYANFLILGVYFISWQYPDFRSQFIRRHPQVDDQTSSISMLRSSAIKGALGYVRVQVLWFSLILVVSTLFFHFLGFQYAALIGVAGALLELVPQFGCGVFYIPWAIICFLVQDVRSGWIVTGFYVFYSMLRRLLDPKLLGDNLGMSPLMSLMGMFVGMRVGGVIGLILGPIVMVVLVSAVRAKIFDGTIADFGILVRYMKQRWQLGKTDEPTNTEK